MIENIFLNLTDSEWIGLIDGEAEDSHLPKCCSNMSELRDVLISIVRNGRNDEVPFYLINDLKRTLKWVADGHDLSNFKVLQKIVNIVGIAEEHEKQSIEI
mgnify:CR=1 FL=1